MDFFYERVCAFEGCQQPFRTRSCHKRYCSDVCWFQAKAARRRAPRYPRWTPAEIAQLRQLAGQISPAEIAQRLNRTPAAVQARARYLRISLLKHGERHHCAKYSDYLVELSRRMHAEGLKPNAIARVLDVPVGAIKSYVYYRTRLGPCPERW